MAAKAGEAKNLSIFNSVDGKIIYIDWGVISKVYYSNSGSKRTALRSVGCCGKNQRRVREGNIGLGGGLDQLFLFTISGG